MGVVTYEFQVILFSRHELHESQSKMMMQAYNVYIFREEIIEFVFADIGYKT